MEPELTIPLQGDAFHLSGAHVLRARKPILRVPELHIKASEVTGVVGPSGAGKSTLLRLLAGLEAPTEGKVCSRGPHGGPLAPGQVVMVFQRPALLRSTVADNVALGLRLQGERNIEARVGPMLERLGLALYNRRQVRTLSGGEHQRVALARALVMKPAALLLDEPTAHLDPQNVALVERLVNEIQEETAMTVVWVTHNPFQARRVAHSVVLLIGGEVVEHARTEAFFSEAAHPRTQDFLAGRMVW
jgi:tungstate transport system ATP-binding protein